MPSQVGAARGAVQGRGLNCADLDGRFCTQHDLHHGLSCKYASATGLLASRLHTNLPVAYEDALTVYHEQRTSAGALCPGHYRCDCSFPEAEATLAMTDTHNVTVHSQQPVAFACHLQGFFDKTKLR